MTINPAVNDMVTSDHAIDDPWEALKTCHWGTNTAKMAKTSKTAIFDWNSAKWQFWKVIIVKQKVNRGFTPINPAKGDHPIHDTWAALKTCDGGSKLANIAKTAIFDQNSANGQFLKVISVKQ